VLEARDCGKPFDEAEWDMDDVATCYEARSPRAALRPPEHPARFSDPCAEKAARVRACARAGPG
jgi:betaine-aldehyde dehydrogenase